MLDAQVNLLRAVGAISRDDYRMVSQLAELPAVLRGERQHLDPSRVRGARCLEHVWRVPASRVDDQEIPCPGQRLDLPGEYLVESEVVAGRREQRGVSRERDRGVSGAI